MNLMESLIAYLLIEPTITAIVGNRITPAPMPQGSTLPALTVEKISPRVREYSHSGDSNLNMTRLQFRPWANSYSQAQAVITALTALFSGKRLSLPGGLVIQASFIENDIDFFDEEARIYGPVMEIIFYSGG